MALRRLTVGSGDAKVTITVDDTTIQATLTNLRSRVGDFRRYWRDYWAPKFFNDITELFDTEGAAVGGWRALSPAYAAWKRSRVGNKPILTFSGAMRASFVRGNRNNVFKPTRTNVEAGSRLDRVGFHNRGDGVPKRQVLWMAPGREYEPDLRQFLAEEMRAAGFTGVRSA